MKRCLALAVSAGALVLPSASWAEGGGSGQVSVRAARVATSAAGCRTVDVARVGRDIFGFVVYKFHQVKRWCWRYPRITSVSVSTYVSDVDPNMEYRGIFGSVS